MRRRPIRFGAAKFIGRSKRRPYITKVRLVHADLEIYEGDSVLRGEREPLY